MMENMKVYVEVTAKFDTDGIMMPVSFIWEEGTVYQIDRIKANGGAYDILFLDAEDSVLVKRYKETRRSHPLAGSERVDKGIAKESERLAFLKERASYILDTSQLLTRELKAEIEKNICAEPGL